MPVTLRDVAQAAGVSLSTASRSLNGQARNYRISNKTEQLVRETADRLGFQASRAARTLRLRRSELIGVVVPDLANPFFAAIAREATLAAEAAGYSVVIADSRETTAHERRLISELCAHEVEALIVCPVGIESDHLVEVDNSGLPIVLIDRGFRDSKLVTVTSDHGGGAEKAARVLVDNGHHTIGVLQGLPGTLPNEERLSGFRRTLNAAGISVDENLIAGDNFTEESGYAASKELLGMNPEISALFAISSPNSLGALRAISEFGLSVPTDVSLVTFDDHPFAEFMKVPLSTASQRVTDLGRNAASLTLERLKTGERKHEGLCVVPIDFIPRASVRNLRPDAIS